MSNTYTSRSLVGAGRTTPSPKFEITSDDYRRMGVGFLGSVALCAAWKKHRVLGFLLGGAIAGAAYNVVSPPPKTTF